MLKAQLAENKGPARMQNEAISPQEVNRNSSQIRSPSSHDLSAPPHGQRPSNQDLTAPPHTLQQDLLLPQLPQQVLETRAISIRPG